MGLSPQHILAEGASEERRALDAKEKIAIAEQATAGFVEDSGHGGSATVFDPNNLPQRKRKSGLLDGSSLQDEEISKKTKLTCGEADDVRYESGFRPDITRRLPAEIWHHIFSCSTPRSLGRFLLVNKLFHHYLDPTSRVEATPPSFPTSSSSLSALKPDAIWQASRRLYWPRMPAPLKGRSELEMWRLACSQTCQFCRRKGRHEAGRGLSDWQTGPGVKGVSPVFPFFVVSCGQCLVERSIKEIDIALSSSIPYFLLSSLPMIFLSSDMHVIPPQVIRSTGVPFNLNLTKLFWPELLDKAKADLGAVQKLGPAAGEEWAKGLDTKGKGFLADTSRWEKWYLSGGISQMRQSEVADLPSSTKKTSVAVSSAKATGLASSGKQSVVLDGQEQVNTKAAGLSGIPPMAQTSSQRLQGLIDKEAMKLRTQRRIEIMKKVSQLKPPILPRDLIRIPSFRAALQSISPFDNFAWKRLKPLLQEQHRSLVNKAKRNMAASITSQAAADSSAIREATDGEWTQAQGLLRARIAQYADEIMNNSGSGTLVKKNNRSEFAVEVLIQVRKRFYDQVLEDAMVALDSGSEPVSDPLGGPWTQKLTLENMRWLFEAKIKPHIDNPSKGLFLCRICEKIGKWYGLEAVIQHYAAKHTRSLSKHSIVVNWRAEWPEDPIFTFDGRDSAKQVATTVAAESASDINPVASFSEASNDAVAPPVPRERSDLLQSHQSAVLPYCRQGGKEGPSDRAEGHAYPNNTPSKSTYPYFHSRIKPPAQDSQILPDDPYRARIVFMANNVKNAWKNLAPVNHIPGSVKICTIIHHIAKDFQAKYAEPAPFEMFRDGLANHESFLPLRGLPNLACNVCMSSFGSQERGTYSLLKLVDHFYQSHGKRLLEQNAPPDDWRVDMIWLPDLGALEGLEMALRKKRQAWLLILDALPWVFKGKKLVKGKETEGQEPLLPLPPASHVNEAHVCDPAPKAIPATQQSQPPKEPWVIDSRPLLRPASVVYDTNTRYQSASRPPHHQISGNVQGTPQGQALKQERDSAVNRVASPIKALYGQSQSQLNNGMQQTSMLGAGQTTHNNQGSARKDRQDPMRSGPDRDLDDVQFVESRRVVRDRRGRSTSPRPFHDHEQPIFRQRSPRPAAYAQVPLDYRGGYSPHPVPPFSMYEVYQVQDPRGDYIVRRPIRAEEAEMVTYVPQDRRDTSAWYPYYTTAREYAPPERQQHGFYAGERPPAQAKSTENGDYDPRYPATGSYGEGSPHRARRP